MLKKMILSACMVLAMGASNLNANFGGDCCDCCQDFQFYAGITGGISAFSGHFRSSAPLPNGSSLAQNASFGGTHGLFGGVLGVQTTVCDDWYVAGQINLLYCSLNRRIGSLTDAAGTPNAIATLKNRFQYGFDGRIGMTTCSGATPYVLGGVESGKFTLQLENQTGTSNAGIPANSRLSNHRTLWGPKVGFGVNFPICCEWVANFEYSYTWFGHIQRRLNDVPTTLNFTHKQNVRQNSVLLGLNYLF